MSKTKRCAKCGRNRPLERFGKRTASKDGLTSRCSDCLRRHGRQRATKTCPKCGQTKKRDQWGKRSRALDGLQTYCKACCRLTAEKYRVKFDCTDCGVTYSLPTTNNPLYCAFCLERRQKANP